MKISLWFITIRPGSAIIGRSVFPDPATAGYQGVWKDSKIKIMFHVRVLCLASARKTGTLLNRTRVFGGI
jgi:hypothetical protein